MEPHESFLLGFNLGVAIMFVSTIGLVLILGVKPC